MVLQGNVPVTSIDDAIDLLHRRLRSKVQHRAEHPSWLRRRTGVPEPGEWRHADLPTERPDHFNRPEGERQLVRHKSFTVADALIEHGPERSYRLTRLRPTAIDTGPTAVPVVVSEQAGAELTVEEAITRLEVLGERFGDKKLRAVSRGSRRSSCVSRRCVDRPDMSSSPENAAGFALQTLFGATTAVCRGEMDAASWLVADAEAAGAAEMVLSISPLVVKKLLGRIDPPLLDGDPGILTCEFGLACRGRFPEGSGSIGSLCLLAAAGRIDPWKPECVFAIGLAATVPVWGAVASTWFAAERLAAAYGEDPATAAERICLQIAAQLSV